MNWLRDQGRDYEKNVLMFISGRMFLVVIDNNHLQRVFTSRHFYLSFPVWHLNYLMLSEETALLPTPGAMLYLLRWPPHSSGAPPTASEL